MIEISSFHIGETGADVDILRIGNTSIYRLADIDRIAWPATALFRDLSVDRLHAIAPRVPAGTIDIETSTIRISFNSYLIRMPDRVVLVDTGVGNDKERPDRPAWHRRKGRFLETMKLLGFSPQSVDIVVNTHLHADHVGWNTTLVSGRWTPTFPNARYIVPAEEFDHWSRRFEASEDGQTLHGAFDDSVLPLDRAGVLDKVPADHEILPGLRLEPAFGHSPGMCVLKLDAYGETVIFTADVLHHPLQLVERDLASNFCADSTEARAARESLIAQSLDRKSILAPYHFQGPGFGRIERRGRRLQYSYLAT